MYVSPLIQSWEEQLQKWDLNKSRELQMLAHVCLQWMSMDGRSVRNHVTWFCFVVFDVRRDQLWLKAPYYESRNKKKHTHTQRDHYILILHLFPLKTWYIIHGILCRFDLLGSFLITFRFPTFLCYDSGIIIFISLNLAVGFIFSANAF